MERKRRARSMAALAAGALPLLPLLQTRMNAFERMRPLPPTQKCTDEPTSPHTRSVLSPFAQFGMATSSKPGSRPASAMIVGSAFDSPRRAASRHAVMVIRHTMRAVTMRRAHSQASSPKAGRAPSTNGRAPKAKPLA